MFVATACPGTYLQSKLPYITEEINKRLNGEGKIIIPPQILMPVSRKIGDIVDISGIYVASNSTRRLNPARTRGEITRIIEGAKNPYLLDYGNLGWTNDGCIVEVEVATTNTKIAEYIVKQNDCLSIIGEKLSVNWRQIASLNHIHSPYIIYVGQKLKIPMMVNEVKKLKSNEEICREIWQGKWGNGGNRMYRLKEAGYQASLIQSMVNKGIGK